MIYRKIAKGLKFHQIWSHWSPLLCTYAYFGQIVYAYTSIAESSTEQDCGKLLCL